MPSRRVRSGKVPGPASQPCSLRLLSRALSSLRVEGFASESELNAFRRMFSELISEAGGLRRLAESQARELAVLRDEMFLIGHGGRAPGRPCASVSGETQHQQEENT